MPRRFGGRRRFSRGRGRRRFGGRRRGRAGRRGRSTRPMRIGFRM